MKITKCCLAIVSPMNWATLIIVLFAQINLGVDRAQAAILFDNGPTDETRTTWNVTNNTTTNDRYTAFDDFVLAEKTLITEIEYSIFLLESTEYVSTHVSFLDDEPSVGGPVAPAFEAVAGSIASNSLSTTVFAGTYHGFTHSLDGLSVLLDPGTYFLGLSIEMANSPIVTGGVAIASGPGSAMTIGPGLYHVIENADPQNPFLVFPRDGDHMSVRLFGEVIPEPASAALLALAAVLLGTRDWRVCAEL